MQKLLDRRKENFVGQQTYHDNDNHDPNDLLHGAQFAAIMVFRVEAPILSTE